MSLDTLELQGDRPLTTSSAPSRPSTGAGYLLRGASRASSRPSTAGPRYSQPIGTEELVADVKSARHSTIPTLAEADVANVWWRVSQSISAALVAGKGVNVAGFGTFGVDEAGFPAFVLSEQFGRKHGLRSRFSVSLGTTPITPLNHAQICLGTPFDRATIENTVHEVILALERKVKSPRGIALTLYGVGRMSIKHGKVKMAFFGELLHNMGLMEDKEKLAQFLGRPGTVGLYDTASRAGTSSRAGSSRSVSTRAVTPRMLRTPLLAGEGGEGSTARFAASAASDVLTLPEIQETQAADPADYKPIKWQSHVAGGTQIGIIDPEPDQRTELPPAVLRKPAAMLDAADLSTDELAHAKLLRQRNQHSSLHGPVEDYHGAVDEVEKREHWDVHEGPKHHLPTHVPRRHKNDNPGVEKLAHKQGYRQWSKEQYCGHTQGKTRHRCFVCTQRGKIQPDASIARRAEAQESEATKRLQELTLRQHKKMEALELLLEQERRETEKKTADFNRTLASERPKTAKEQEAKMDVFAFRPATSQGDIRRMRTDHALDLLAQHNTHALHKHRSKAMMASIEHAERQHIERANQQHEEAARTHRAQVKQLIRRELDGQLEYKTAREKHYVDAHPRAKVPFDVKHLPGSNVKARRINSAHGRPAAALGPEMYKSHDEREKKSKEFAKKVYEEQVEMRAARNQAALEARQKEKDTDKAILGRVKAGFLEDVRRQDQESLQKRQSLEQTWKQAHGQKLERDQKEIEHIKAPAELTIMEQMDDYARCNMCERDVANTGTSQVVSGKFMKAHTIVS